MTIGELAEMSGASARSIRYYEAAGLLTPKRLSNSYREFDRADIETVKQIGLLLQLGFPIKAIQELAPCFPESVETIAVCQKIRTALIHHRAKLKRRYSELGKLLAKIDVIVSAPPYEQAKS